MKYIFIAMIIFWSVLTVSAEWHSLEYYGRLIVTHLWIIASVLYKEDQ